MRTDARIRAGFPVKRAQSKWAQSKHPREAVAHGRCKTSIRNRRHGDQLKRKLQQRGTRLICAFRRQHKRLAIAAADPNRVIHCSSKDIGSDHTPERSDQIPGMVSAGGSSPAVRSPHVP